MRANRIILPLLLISVTLSLLAAGQEPDKEKALLDNLDVFTDVLTMIEAEYYRDMESKELMMGAVEGLLASLDRYSYIKENAEEDPADIGIDLAIVDNILTVVAAVEGSPAARAGIIHGDMIVKINGDRINDVTIDEVRRMLRGEPGSEVELTLYREGTKGGRDVVLERQEIPSPGLVESLVYEDAIGYIRLASLPAGSAREFIKGVEQLLKEGVKGLIIDLRDNPGGSIDEAAEIVGYLIGNDTKIASIESRLKSERREFTAPAAPPPDVSVAVLVNGGTAREAEVIAGSLKESGHSIVIGPKTFGDDSIQKDIPLNESLSLHLTVGRYIIAGGTSFDDVGIEPDVEAQIKPEKEAVLQEIREGIDVKMDEKEKPVDSQLQRAIDLLKGIDILAGKVSG